MYSLPLNNKNLVPFRLFQANFGWFCSCDQYASIVVAMVVVCVSFVCFLFFTHTTSDFDNKSSDYYCTIVLIFEIENLLLIVLP